VVLPEEDGRRELLQRKGLVLPDTLTARGWKLIIRAPDRLFAVSEAWGCTETKGTINEVVAEAWGMTSFCEYINRKKAEEHHAEA